MLGQQDRPKHCDLWLPDTHIYLRAASSMGCFGFLFLFWPCHAFLVAQTIKNLPARKGPGFNLWVRNFPQRSEWMPTPVFLPGESHGQRSLPGYSPWGSKELDMTEQLTEVYHVACGMMPQRGIKPGPLQWKHRILITRHQGTLSIRFLIRTKCSLVSSDHLRKKVVIVFKNAYLLVKGNALTGEGECFKVALNCYH